jgi:hypothetical protein
MTAAVASTGNNDAAADVDVIALREATACAANGSRSTRDDGKANEVATGGTGGRSDVLRS